MATVITPFATADASAGVSVALIITRMPVESAGARLGLVSTDPTVFELAMPVAVRDEVVAPAAAQPS